MNQEKVIGMVLSATPVGDYDKRLLILTKERGKIAAFAKGARRPNCALLASSQPFVFGSFQLYQGRNSYTVSAAEVSNYFEGLRDNFEAACYGFYFCEFAEYLSRENMEASDFLKLLYQTMKALIKNTIDFALIRYIFELKMMAFNGEAPQVFECVKCASHTPGHVFYPGSGGLLCNSCAASGKGGILLDEASLYTMQYILATPVEKLYTFKVSHPVMEKLKEVTKAYLSVYINHSFRSLEFLEVF